MSRAFGSQSTTDDVLEGIDLTGQVAIVTGASGGIGEETARVLAGKGAKVTILARDAAKVEQAAEGIRKSTGNQQVDVGVLELDRPATIRSFAQAWLANNDSLNLLINNAGVMACPLSRTAEGWEMQFATNHLGHFLLTCLLSSALVKGAPARVINLSSGGHHISPVVFDDIHFNDREYERFSSYGQSKTANILFSIELDRRLRDRGVRSNAAHPGLVDTDLGRHMSQEEVDALLKNRPATLAGMKTIPQGASTSVWMATAPELAAVGGQFAMDCNLVDPEHNDQATGGWAKWAQGEDDAQRLWEVSEEMLGETFEI